MDSTVTTSSLYNNASITSTLNDDNVRRDHEENKIGLPRESIYLQIHRAYFVRTSLVKPECAYYYYRLVGLADVAKCYLDLYLMYFLSPYKKGILAEQISAGADIKNLYSSHFIFFVALIQHKNKISHEGDKEAIYHFF